MGLDMYLSAKKYLWSLNDEDKHLQEAINELIDLEPTMRSRFRGCSLLVKGIEIEAMYWRKAYEIHNWFIKEIQNGVDDCGEYFVPHYRIQDLISLCRKAIDEKDSTLLGKDVTHDEGDQWFWDNLKHTVEELTIALYALPESHYSLYYQSSW